MREYKKLLILILKERKINYVTSNWKINDKIKIDQVQEKEILKREVRLNYVTLEENILVTWFLREDNDNERDVDVKKSKFIEF